MRDSKVGPKHYGPPAARPRGWGHAGRGESGEPVIVGDAPCVDWVLRGLRLPANLKVAETFYSSACSVKVRVTTCSTEPGNF